MMSKTTTSYDDRGNDSGRLTDMSFDWFYNGPETKLEVRRVRIFCSQGLGTLVRFFSVVIVEPFAKDGKPSRLAVVFHAGFAMLN